MLLSNADRWISASGTSENVCFMFDGSFIFGFLFFVYFDTFWCQWDHLHQVVAWSLHAVGVAGGVTATGFSIFILSSRRRSSPVICVTPSSANAE